MEKERIDSKKTLRRACFRIEGTNDLEKIHPDRVSEKITDKHTKYKGLLTSIRIICYAVVRDDREHNDTSKDIETCKEAEKIDGNDKKTNSTIDSTASIQGYIGFNYGHSLSYINKVFQLLGVESQYEITTAIESTDYKYIQIYSDHDQFHQYGKPHTRGADSKPIHQIDSLKNDEVKKPPEKKKRKHKVDEDKKRPKKKPRKHKVDDVMRTELNSVKSAVEKQDITMQHMSAMVAKLSEFLLLNQPQTFGNNTVSTNVYQSNECEMKIIVSTPAEHSLTKVSISSDNSNKKI